MCNIRILNILAISKKDIHHAYDADPQCIANTQTMHVQYMDSQYITTTKEIYSPYVDPQYIANTLLETHVQCSNPQYLAGTRETYSQDTDPLCAFVLRIRIMRIYIWSIRNILRIGVLHMRRGGGLGSRPIFKKFHETYAPS